MMLQLSQAVIILMLYALLILGIRAHNTNTKLLLISFDGFRHDYLQKVKDSGRSTPNFDSLIKDGVEAEYMKNIYVTKTLPNHYTIVTGHYAESHGVIDNDMYDPVYKEFYYESTQHANDTKWYNNGTVGGGAEPIWVTNEKGYQSSLFPRRSGIVGWPGGDISIHGHTAAHTVPFSYYLHDFSNHSRIEKIVEWFTTEDKPINLGLLYFEDPDHLGHQVGPNSEIMYDHIVALDGVVGDLIKQLKEKDLFHHLNIIITSDHGMAEVSPDKVVFLEDYIDSSSYLTPRNSLGFTIKPNAGETFKKNMCAGGMGESAKKLNHVGGRISEIKLRWGWGSSRN